MNGRERTPYSCTIAAALSVSTLCKLPRVEMDNIPSIWRKISQIAAVEVDWAASFCREIS